MLALRELQRVDEQQLISYYQIAGVYPHRQTSKQLVNNLRYPWHALQAVEQREGSQRLPVWRLLHALVRPLRPVAPAVSRSLRGVQVKSLSWLAAVFNHL